jgi:hypothetical protein
MLKKMNSLEYQVSYNWENNTEINFKEMGLGAVNWVRPSGRLL